MAAGTVGKIKFGPQKFLTKIKICSFSVEKFGPKITGAFEIFGQKLNIKKVFEKLSCGKYM